MVASPSSSTFGSASNLDLVRVAREVAEQKGLQFSAVLGAVESAIRSVAQKQFGKAHIKVEVNPCSGETLVMKGMKVIASHGDLGYDVDDGFTHILLSDAIRDKPDIKVGDEYYIPVEGMTLGRSHMQIIRRSLLTIIGSIEREKQYKEYSTKVGDIVYGLVRRVEHGSIIIEHNNTELCLSTSQLIGSETFRAGDRIKASIDKVRRVDVGHQVLLSRSANSFLIALMKQEIPEIYDGIVTIKAVARVPGMRAKVAVYSTDQNVDAVGSCIGRRGMRINNVSKEICGEKIDVVLFSSDLATFVTNSLVPADVIRVVVDQQARKIEVVCAENKLNLAIGKEGSNVRLASRLVGWGIDVMSEDMETKKRVDEFNQLTMTLSSALDVEEIIAQLLLAEGYGSVDEVANSTVESLASINGFNEELAAQLIERGKKYIAKNVVADKAPGIGLGALLAGYPKFYDALSANKVATIQDFADLSIWDVVEIVDTLSDYSLDEKTVGDLILSARKIGGMFDNDGDNA